MSRLGTTIRYAKKCMCVDGHQLAYLEEDSGARIVLLHGNPTSAFLWRNVVPELTGTGRVFVPDLIGQGDSVKLDPALGPKRYTFQVVYEYLQDAGGAGCEPQRDSGAARPIHRPLTVAS